MAQDVEPVCDTEEDGELGSEANEDELQLKGDWEQNPPGEFSSCSNSSSTGESIGDTGNDEGEESSDEDVPGCFLYRLDLLLSAPSGVGGQGRPGCRRVIPA